MKSIRCLIFLSAFLIVSFSNFASANTGLEIDNPTSINIVYTIEPDDIDIKEVRALIENLACHAGMRQSSRNDAQLFVRVEKHGGAYLLYLDFNRQLFYHANGHKRSTKGFVWGRYANNIDSKDELFEDLVFFAEEFFSDYQHANTLK